MENEFGTKNEDEIVKKILEKGDVQSSEVRSHALTYPLNFLHFEHQANRYHTERRAPGQHQRQQGRHGWALSNDSTRLRLDDEHCTGVMPGLKDGWHVGYNGLKDLC
jgi:hypothetical protein